MHKIKLNVTTNSVEILISDIRESKIDNRIIKSSKGKLYIHHVAKTLSEYINENIRSK